MKKKTSGMRKGQELARARAREEENIKDCNLNNHQYPAKTSEQASYKKLPESYVGPVMSSHPDQPSKHKKDALDHKDTPDAELLDVVPDLLLRRANEENSSAALLA